MAGMDDGRFAGRVAFVTGAGTGIGRAAALAFAREGALVAATGIAAPQLQETVEAIGAAGGRAIGIPCDVTRSDEVEAALRKTMEALGRLDFAFNNAGVEQPILPTAEIAEEEWDRIVDVNLRGVFLDNGVTPREISEIMTHLAFYSGWGNAMAAVAAAREVFAERKIGPDQLPAASPQLLPLDETAEAQHAARVAEQFGQVSPGTVQYTAEVLFRDLWLRPDLAPRDRSLVTVSALIAAGQVAQVPYHLNRAMDNGLTQPQAAEIITHLAFYAGWPNAFSALPVAKDVFETRGKR